MFDVVWLNVFTHGNGYFFIVCRNVEELQEAP